MGLAPDDVLAIEPEVLEAMLTIMAERARRDQGTGHRKGTPRPDLTQGSGS